MGFGDTAKRIQTLADKAEQTYQKLNDLRDEVQETQATVTDTADRVRGLETELAEQRSVLDAIAHEVGVDLDTVSTEAHISEAEAAAGGESEDGEGDGGAADNANGAETGSAKDEG